MMFEKLADEIIAGRRLGRADDLTFLVEGDLEALMAGANRIRAELCGDSVDLCTIINGRAGRCSENCKFCAQSAHHPTCADEYDFLEPDEIIEACRSSRDKGAHRFSIVTAGKDLSGDDLEKALSAYGSMRDECSGIHLCASHGFLSEEDFVRLKESGVSTYHCNIETSRRNFPNVCTTHTYDDKIANIRRAQRAGLHVCSGGIIGMGETWQDRIDMALDLAELGVVSIPINSLMPIPGTPLEALPALTEDEILRTISIFRYIAPDADIRLAAGRSLMQDSGRRAFFAGANATITGDMLTTSGNNTEQDKQMLTESGFDIVSSHDY